MRRLLQGHCWSAIALLVVVALGALNIPYPFFGDQALFTLGALELREGGRLYRDFWDLKQPGIFWFYFAGGSLFGFTEEGIHLFELLYWTVFSACFLVIARRDLQSDRAAAAGLLLGIGAYYAAARASQLTQLEMLVAAPLFVGTWLLSVDYRSSRIQRLGFAAAGVMGAVVVAFKLVFAPILLALVASTVLARGLIARRGGASMDAPSIGLLFAGFFGPLAVLLVLWRTSGDLGLIYRTFVQVPSRMLSVDTAKASLGQLERSLVWFVTCFSVTASLGAVGVVLTLERPRTLFRLNMVLWLTVGVGVILLQRTSWWEYHMLLLLVPFAYLSPLAVRRIASDRKARVALAFGAFVLLIPAAQRLSWKVLPWPAIILQNVEQPAVAYKRAVSDSYAAILADDEFLHRPQATRDPIAVLGDPLHNYLARRPQATVINGGILELFPTELWAALSADLQRARPQYIFVASCYETLIAGRGPDIERLLASSYRRHSTVTDGVWYERD